ncbi:MAG: hypothetical protein J1F40_09140 [Prevotellaceae bacterium]|nr:hypothetical protein [Prevotellaceae bacterium]
MIDFLNKVDNISDEMLAAYIDGNSTPEESAIIQNTIRSDDILAEAIEIVHDIPFGNDDWNISDGSSATFYFDSLPIAKLGFFSSENDCVFENGVAGNEDFVFEFAASEAIIDGDRAITDNESVQLDDNDSLHDLDNMDALIY